LIGFMIGIYWCIFGNGPYYERYNRVTVNKSEASVKFYVM